MTKLVIALPSARGGDQPEAHSVGADCDLDADWASAPGGHWITERTR